MRPVHADILPRVREAIDWPRVVGPDGAVLCALSGGPDSVALCDVLMRLGTELPFRLCAAHLNHGIRGEEADADEEFVREFCRERDIPLEVGHVDVPARASESRQSLEMAARNARYEFLMEAAKSSECALIALGHTADDRVENLLLRLFRGAGGRGLGSLQTVRTYNEISLLRPLLEIHKTETLAYLEWRGLPYRTDTTNLSDETDRGRVRNVLLPKLEELAHGWGWGSVRKSLARSASLLAEDEKALGDQAFQHRDGVGFGEEGELYLYVSQLFALPSPILARVILRAFERMHPTLRPEREHIDAIEGLLKGTRRGPCDLPGGLRAEILGEAVVIRPPQPEPSPPPPVEIPLDGLPKTVDFGPYRLSFSLAKPAEERTQTSVQPSHGWIHIAVPDNCQKLILRAPELGDRMAPLGMGGHTKKLSDIFIDNKLPKDERTLQPVLVDPSDGAILALPWLGIIAETARIKDDTTRILGIVTETATGGPTGDVVTWIAGR